MGACSSIYGWAGGHNPPAKSPECPRRKHAELINRSGRQLFEARNDAYREYCRECAAWGREPEDEQTWFSHANAAATRLRRDPGKGAKP